MTLKYLTAFVGLLCCITTIRARPPHNQLGKELISADRKAEKMLQDGRNPGYTPLGNLRLLKHGKMKPINLQFAIGSGLQEAIPVMSKAKADLYAAFKAHHKVNGPMAATFLARYAWFRAAYVCRNNGYPLKRFRKLVQRALKLAPENPQALLMNAWLSYQAHSKFVFKPWPNGQPGGTFETIISGQARRKVERMLKKILHVAPNNFEAWYINLLDDSTNNQQGKEQVPGGRIWLGILRTAKNADLFYFTFNKSQYITGKMGILPTARMAIKWYPKYYAEYAKHKTSQ